MSGGSWEYSSAYINNGNTNLTIYGNGMINADIKYKNVYEKASSENRPNNYTENKHMYGDAIWETSNSGDCSNCSWNSDYSYMPYSSYLFFHRGGGSGDISGAGLFVFYGGHLSIPLGVISFRPIVSIK